MRKECAGDSRAVTSDVMEELLNAWMGMSISIKGNRILKDLSFNEMVICRLLYRAEQEGREVTATDICSHARLLKSQVNKLLDGMEKRGLIYKHRDSVDRRRVFIRMNEDKKAIYLAEHEHVMAIIEKICEKMSAQETEVLIEKMEKVVLLMDTVLQEQ